MIHELQVTLAALQQNVSGASSPSMAAGDGLISSPYFAYQQLVRRVQAAVQASLPPNSTVLVVSKGDSKLLELDGRRAWHFPQTEHGTYAGHYPVDSAAAIAQLEALRAKGAEFLVFPSPSFW